MHKDNEVDEKAPVYVATAPERIFLQVADDAYYAEDPFSTGAEITWCDHSVMALEVAYRREDLHAATVAELRAEVEKARIAGIDACEKLTALWQKDIDRADAAERRVGELERVCAEAYQVVGVLLSDTGQFDTDHGEKILDNLSEARIVHEDVLPWASLTGADPT